MAVWLFWAISGFIFYWRYAEPIHARAVDGGKFFVWRLSRLYPLHLLTLGAVVLMQALYLRHHDEPFIYPLEAVNLQFLLASNWIALLPKTFNWPIWSVSVEALIYAIFFLAARRLRPGLGSCLGLCALAIALSFAPFAPYLSDLLHCAMLFFAGGFVCLLIARLDRAARRKAFWLAVGIAALSAPLAFRHGLADEHPDVASGVALSLAIVVGFALIDHVVRFDLRRFARLGDLTYGSYLWHFPLQLALVVTTDALGLGRELFYSPLLLILWLAMTFALAYGSHRLFERPAQDAIRRAWRRLAPAPAAQRLAP
ncbi:acyltransferase family protein [Rhodoblastus sp.]|uniref:acyltransferase family protein n=1 Tax=Rhodoblastus sp. TaxID=1962975 RepID=UPI0035B01E7D